jgi:hypothetical protein
MAYGLLPLAVGDLVCDNTDCAEHLVQPIPLGAIAEWPAGYVNAAGHGGEFIVVLGLPKGWEFVSAISAPAVKEVEGDGGKRADDRVGIPHTTHIFHLPVLVDLPIPHDRHKARRRLVRFRALML